MNILLVLLISMSVNAKFSDHIEGCAPGITRDRLLKLERFSQHIQEKQDDPDYCMELLENSSSFARFFNIDLEKANFIKLYEIPVNDFKAYYRPGQCKNVIARLEKNLNELRSKSVSCNYFDDDNTFLDYFSTQMFPLKELTLYERMCSSGISKARTSSLISLIYSATQSGEKNCIEILKDFSNFSEKFKLNPQWKERYTTFINALEQTAESDQDVCSEGILRIIKNFKPFVDRSFKESCKELDADEDLLNFLFTYLPPRDKQASYESSPVTFAFSKALQNLGLDLDSQVISCGSTERGNQHIGDPAEEVLYSAHYYFSRRILNEDYNIFGDDDFPFSKFFTDDEWQISTQMVSRKIEQGSCFTKDYYDLQKNFLKKHLGVSELSGDNAVPLNLTFLLSAFDPPSFVQFRRDLLRIRRDSENFELGFDFEKESDKDNTKFMYESLTHACEGLLYLRTH